MRDTETLKAWVRSGVNPTTFTEWNKLQPCTQAELLEEVSHREDFYDFIGRDVVNKIKEAFTAWALDGPTCQKSSLTLTLRKRPSVFAAMVGFLGIAAHWTMTKSMKLCQCARPVPVAAWDSPASWDPYPPPLIIQCPPFSKRGKPAPAPSRAGVVNFIFHTPFYLAFSKIRERPNKILFSKILR